MSVVWYPELATAVRFPGALVFAQLGSFHRTPSFDSDALLGLTDFGANWLGADDGALTDWSAESSDTSVLLLDLDALDLQSRRSEEILTNLRPPLTAARERGARIVFVSSRPLADFPVLAGSSILLDAETLHIRPVEETRAGELARSLGITNTTTLANVVKFGIGSRALLHSFAGIEGMRGGGNKKREAAREREKALALQVFTELGSEIGTWLEYWIFECRQNVLDQVDVPEGRLTTLLAAGVITALDNEQFKLLPAGHEDAWLTALSESLTQVTVPSQAWTHVAQELFSFEREVRAHLSRTYLQRHGPEWHDLVLHKDQDSIVELARRDAIPSASTLSDIRCPLDWVQMSRLLEFASSEAATSGRFLGLNEREWKTLGDDLLPVRHRIAHMRLVRPDDRELIRRHRRLIRVRQKMAARVT